MTNALRSRSRQVSRRAFLQGIGIGSTTLLLAACPAPAPADEGASGGAAPAAEDIELDFFAWGDASDIPAWEELASTYGEMYPNVTVKPSISGTGVDYYTKLQTTFAGGVIPEVASFQGWEWQPFSDAGLLAPIDAYIERDGFDGPYPDGVDSIEFSTRRDGSRYLIPLQSGVMVMFYAKNVFDEAGVAYPTDDWTFEDFVSIAEQLTSTDGDSKMYGYQANGSYARDIHWIRATGVQEFDELVDPRTAMFDQPEIIDILQMVAQDFMYSLGISPTPADLEGGTNTIDTGNAAMKYEGPWFFPRLNSPELREEGKEIEFDVVLMPQMADESRPHRGWAEGVCVPKSEQVDAAWDFVHYMGGEDGQKIYSTITGRIPNTSDLVENFWGPTIEERFGVSNAAAFSNAFLRSEVDVIGGVSRGQIWSEVAKPVGWDPMLANSATAAEVMSAVNEGVQGLLDAHWARQG